MKKTSSLIDQIGAKLEEQVRKSMVYQDVAERTSQLTSQLFKPAGLGGRTTSSNDNPFLEEPSRPEKKSSTPQVHTMNPYEQLVGNEEVKSAGSPPTTKKRQSIVRDDGEFEFEVDVSADADTPVDLPAVAAEEEKKMQEISVSVSSKKEVASTMKQKNDATKPVK